VILSLALSLLIPAATGVLLLGLVWPRAVVTRPGPLSVALGAGLGVGLSSILLDLWILVFGPSRGYVLAEAGLLAVVIGLTLKRRRTGSAEAASPGVVRPALVLLALGFAATAAAALGAFVSSLRQKPHGEWDAWMNWDLRARMLFRGGDGWLDAFSSTFPWSHPDYPVLLPSLVVRSWLYAGVETLLSPALVAGAFTFGTAALLVISLRNLRSTSQGLLAGIVLLSTPFFILHGTSLYADVPLGFFFLATMVFLELDARDGDGTSRFAALAGLAAGLAMWTKNEGTLFTLSVLAGILITGRTHKGVPWQRRWRAFGLGLLPVLIIVIGFKLAFAPANDLISTISLEHTFGRITDSERYLLTLREYASHITMFGVNRFGSAVLVLLAYLLLLGVRSDGSGRTSIRAGSVALILLLAGHFAVFVSMAHELARLLNSSLDRLLLQLWPSALFLFFLAVRTPEEATAAPLPTGPVLDRS
jgi:hypothetical protein